MSATAGARPTCHACGSAATHCPRCVCRLIGARRLALREAQGERTASLAAVQAQLDDDRPALGLRADTAEREERARALRAQVERVRAELAHERERLTRGREHFAVRKAELERARATLPDARLAGQGGASVPLPPALLEASRNLAAMRRRLIRKLLRTYRVTLLEDAPGAAPAERDTADTRREHDERAADSAAVGDLGSPRWSLLGLPVPPFTAGALESVLDSVQAGTALGHIAHVLHLAAGYACVRLPFDVDFCGSRSSIGLPPPLSDASAASPDGDVVRRPAAATTAAPGVPSPGGRQPPGPGGAHGSSAGAQRTGARSWPLYLQTPVPGGGGGSSDGSVLLGIPMLGAGSGWGAASGPHTPAGGAAPQLADARARLARAIAMLVVNVHFLAASCGLGARAGADAPPTRARALSPPRAAPAGRAIGAFDTLSTLVAISSASTLAWELRSTRCMGADGADAGADELLAHAWGSSLVASVMLDASGSGEWRAPDSGTGAAGPTAGAGAPGGAARRMQAWGGRAAVAGGWPARDEAIDWALIERPRIPTPAQEEDIVQWTRAMITDTVLTGVPLAKLSPTRAPS